MDKMVSYRAFVAQGRYIEGRFVRNAVPTSMELKKKVIKKQRRSK
jgi:hypothetical protein